MVIGDGARRFTPSVLRHQVVHVLPVVGQAHGAEAVHELALVDRSVSVGIDLIEESAHCRLVECDVFCALQPVSQV